MEVEFLSQMRYNLYVSPQQWEEWRITVSRMFNYHRRCSRTKKALYSSIPSPPVSTISTTPSFSEQPTYFSPGSPFRIHFTAQSAAERMSPHSKLPSMDESTSAASAAIHARVSRKRSREDTTLPSTLQPPVKRHQQQYPAGPLGFSLPPQAPIQRARYSTDAPQHVLPAQYSQKPPRVALTLSLPDQTRSPSYASQHHPQYSLQPTSPSYPTSPYAGSPLSPFSTNSNYNSLSPYAVPPHRPVQQAPQAPLLDNSLPTGYASGFSSPYKYLQNRFSPYAPVRPARTLPSQFIPPRMQWSMMATSTEELWYQPLGLHGHSGLRRGIPTYNPGYPAYPEQDHHQQQ